MERILLRASAPDEILPFLLWRSWISDLKQVVGRAGVALWDTAGVLTAPGGVEGNALLQLPIQTPFSSFKRSSSVCVLSQNEPFLVFCFRRAFFFKNLKYIKYKLSQT